MFKARGAMSSGSRAAHDVVLIEWCCDTRPLRAGKMSKYRGGLELTGPPLPYCEVPKRHCLAPDQLSVGLLQYCDILEEHAGPIFPLSGVELHLLQPCGRHLVIENLARDCNRHFRHRNP